MATITPSRDSVLLVNSPSFPVVLQIRKAWDKEILSGILMEPSLQITPEALVPAPLTTRQLAGEMCSQTS